MNYWLLTTEFPPIHGGGISTYCWHTAKMMIQHGHQVTVFVNDYSVKSIQHESPQNNLTLVRFNPVLVSKGKALGTNARLSLEFANVVEQEMKQKGVPDVLETQDYAGIGYYTLQKKQLLYPLFRDLKVVMTMHAPSFLYFEFNQVPLYKFPEYWIGEMEKASIRMADLVISPSNYLIEELNSRMNLKEKNPIRIFNPYVSEIARGEVPVYEEGDLVFFGKLTPQKGVLEMLSYLKKMWDNGFDKTISIIGGGAHYFYPVQEDMSLYVKKIYAAYIKKGLIKFEGNMPPNELNERLRKAHVVITPSIVDNLPYAVLEAMAMGKIVLSSSNGGHTEVMETGENSFVFHHEIKNSFESTLTNILSKPRQELTEIGKKAQESVFTATNYETVYTQKQIELAKLVANKEKKVEFDFIEIINKKETVESIKESTKDLLSIVIPYYNMGAYIEETLDSLMKVQQVKLEIIIINDGSTDQASRSKLEEIEKKYPVTIFHKENEGLSIARNYGADRTNGEFMAFLDADDTVEPSYYSKALEVLKQYNNVSFVGCWAQYFENSKDIWPTFNPEPPYLLVHNMINSSALVYKKQDFISFGKNDAKFIYGMEDYDSVISMVKKGARGVSLPETWWNYRIRNNSMAQSFTKDKELYLYRLISEKHKQFFASYADRISNLLNYNGSGISFDNPTRDRSKFDSAKYGKLTNSIVRILKSNKWLRNIAKKIYRKIYNN